MASNHISVMIVDDNDMTRTVLRSILRTAGYDVVAEARNGLQAVDMASRLKPDIICLDIVMPEMDGLEALGTIKAARPEVGVIMITGNTNPDAVQDAIQNGAAGFIVKPFNTARVLDTLLKVVARQRQKPA